ncbi:tyrosine-type recombinase/integrase [Helicobacter sp. T3_23-1056]
MKVEHQKTQKMPFVVRGKTLHICTTFEGRRVRFSTGLKNNAQNRAFILCECENIIKEYFAPKIAGKDSLENYAKKFLDSAKTLKKSSQNTYQTSINVLKRYFDFRKNLASFSTEDVERFYAKLNAEGLSANRAKRLKAIANAIFERAFCEGKIPKNPFASLLKKRLSNLRDKKECEPFSLSEIKDILSACDELEKSDKRFFWFKPACVLAFFSGLRSGELLALRWENIDFFSGKIYVKSTINRFGITLPKTKSSLREVDLLPVVAKELGNFARAKFGTDEPKGFLFVDFANKPFINTAGEFGELWRSTLSYAGLSLRRFYNTRHTFASVMISKGENIMWVSKMLGHKNANITLNTYARFIDDGAERAKFLRDFSA